MSTRSLIAMEEGNTFKVIYCHWDGYPSHNGVILDEHYQNRDKALELINLGNLSSLGETIEACDAYGRDWQRTGQEANTLDQENWRILLKDTWAEFVYIYSDQKWHMYSVGEDRMGDGCLFLIGRDYS